MKMTPERWDYTTHYLRTVFGACDDHLTNLMSDAVEQGLPDIAVSPDVGRFLQMLASMTCGQCAVEVGTLAGYSGIWIARGLAPDGRLITIEPVDLHADFAQAQFDKAGVGDRVEIRRGTGLAVLPELVESLGPGSVDLVFLDAVKTEYPDYWKVARPLLKPGGLLIADNVLGASDWWIDGEDHPSRQGVDALNRAVASDPEFHAVALPIREGVLVARRLPLA